MNYIEVNQNKKTQCISHRHVDIYNNVGIQGPSGQKGLTPYINDDGYWCIGDDVTEYKAVGIAPRIGEDGYWYIGDENTGFSAQGLKGDKGDKGEKGDKGDVGYTPYIKDGEWWIADTNTHYKVGVTEEDITVVEFFDKFSDFPENGNVKHLYCSKDNGKLFRFDVDTNSYIRFNQLTTKEESVEVVKLISNALDKNNNLLKLKIDGNVWW